MRGHLMCLALLAATAPLAAHAQEEDASGFEWNAAAASEYMFRGLSQTDDRPALSAGAGYSFANGFYVGAWASNVDFGDGTDLEVDGFVGWNGDVSDAVNLDVQLVRYAYVGEPSGVDYAYDELVGKATFSGAYTATLGYTDDFLASGTDSVYAALGGSWDVGRDVTLSAGVGYTTVQGPDDGYLDYSIGVDRDFGAVNLALAYVGTDGAARDLFGRDAAEDKVVFTVSIGD